MKKAAMLFFVFLFLSGCTNTIDNMIFKKEVEPAGPGIRLIQYLVDENNATAKSGGKALWDGETDSNKVISSANKSNITIAAMYIFIHDYNGEFLIWRDEQSESSYATLAGIVGKLDKVLLSDKLKDRTYQRRLYRDYRARGSSIGLKIIPADDFYDAIDEMFRKSDDIKMALKKFSDSLMESAEEIRIARVQEYEEDHPIIVAHPEDDISEYTQPKLISLKKALGKMKFIYRKGNEENPREIFVENYKNLSLFEIMNSVKARNEECQRVAAYSGYDVERQCIDLTARELSSLADVINNKDISRRAIDGAIVDSTVDTTIFFGHAARLATMHHKLCKKQGESGHVMMVTVAPPCKYVGN